jgi:hypothetical protein
MEHRHDADAAHGPGTQLIDEELARVSAAIDLVAARPASRITLAGLRFGEALLPTAQALAAARGVRIKALWPMGDGPVDLVVEAPGA